MRKDTRLIRRCVVIIFSQYFGELVSTSCWGVYFCVPLTRSIHPGQDNLTWWRAVSPSSFVLSGLTPISRSLRTEIEIGWPLNINMHWNVRLPIGADKQVRRWKVILRKNSIIYRHCMATMRSLQVSTWDHWAIPLLLHSLRSENTKTNALG